VIFHKFFFPFLDKWDYTLLSFIFQKKKKLNPETKQDFLLPMKGMAYPMEAIAKSHLTCG
jgi:hypothetical protein